MFSLVDTITEGSWHLLFIYYWLTHYLFLLLLAQYTKLVTSAHKHGAMICSWCWLKTRYSSLPTGCELWCMVLDPCSLLCNDQPGTWGFLQTNLFIFDAASQMWWPDIRDTNLFSSSEWMETMAAWICFKPYSLLSVKT